MYPLTFKADIENYSIEQFVYETQRDPALKVGDEFSTKKQIMLLFDDQSMDDENDNDSDIGMSACKSEILLQKVEPLFASTSAFEKATPSPLKEEQLSVETQQLMSQTHKSKQNSLFESPIKKKRVLSSSFKSAKAAVNKSNISP